MEVGGWRLEGFEVPAAIGLMRGRSIEGHWGENQSGNKHYYLDRATMCAVFRSLSAIARGLARLLPRGGGTPIEREAEVRAPAGAAVGRA